MDLSTAVIFFKTFLLPVIFILCISVWTCGNKKPSTEKTTSKPKKKKKEEKIIHEKECFGSPEPPTALKPSKIVPSKAAAAPPPAEQKKTSSGEPDAKNQQPQQPQEYPQPQSLVLPSSGESERVKEVNFKSETNKAALKTKTPAAEKKSLPTESTDLKTFDWMLNNNNNNGAPQKVDAS